MFQNALDKMHRGSKSLANREKTGKAAVLPALVQTTEYGLASLGFGYVHGKYQDKAKVMGIPVDVLSGSFLKVAGVALDLVGGKSVAAYTPHLHVVADAGIGSFFHTVGVGLGAKSSKAQQRVLLPAGMAVPAGAIVLGAIPQAPEGDVLNKQDLAALSRMR